MTSEKLTTKEINLILPVKSGMELIAAKLTDKLGKVEGFDQVAIDEIKLATIEACLNAFEHGVSKEKSIKVDFFCSVEKIDVIVKDSGKGFDPKLVVSPEILDKFKSDYKRGWGIKIITELMDKVDIVSDSNGTKIMMTKFK